MTHAVSKALLCGLFLLLPALGAAESNWRLGAALGYGERTNPLVFADNVPIALDLDVAWFGERFFFDNGDLGYTVIDNDLVTASVMARVRSERIFFGRTNLRFVDIGLTGVALPNAAVVEVPDRDYAVEAGFEVLSDGRWGYVQFSAYQDVSGTHRGFDVDLSYGIGFRAGRWYVEPSIGLSYKNSQLNDYYWGIRPSESNAALPIFVADDGINVRARLRASYYLNKNWSLTLSGEYERLSEAIADSPIVADDGVFGYFAGLAWRF